MNKMTPYILIILSLILIGTTGCRNGEAHATLDEKALPVTVTPLNQQLFEDYLTLQGSIEAKNFALVPVRITGTIVDIFAAEGDTVTANETALFQTDPVKLQQAVSLRQQDLEVARCALRERKASLAEIQAGFEKNQIDYKRYKQLLADSVVTQDEFEQRESNWKQGQAKCDHAQAMVDLAEAQVKQADATLAIAEKDLQDTLITAPINGIISCQFREPGEMGISGQPVFRIDDLTQIEVSAFAPAQYYANFQVNKTKVRLSVNDNDLGTYPLSYKSPTIDNKLRTFEMKCLIDNPPIQVAPGSLVQAKVVLQSTQGLGTPRAALVQRNDKTNVFVVRNHKAHLIPIKKGIESDGRIELITDSLNEGDLIVTQGQTLLEDGSAVTIQTARGE